MVRTRITLALYGVILCLLALGASDSYAVSATSRTTLQGEKNLTILSTTSLTHPLTELARLYAKQTNTTVTTLFLSPREIANYIQSGEPADLYISEDHLLTKDLQQKGLIDVYSLTPIAQNRLALVSSSKRSWKDAPEAKKGLADMFDALVKRSLFVIADPKESMLGQASMDVLEHVGQKEKVAPFLVRAGDAKDTEYLIGEGEMAGIVYESDTALNRNLRVITVFSETMHTPIQYDGAAIASEQMEAARAFIHFLTSPESQVVFRKHGLAPAKTVG